MSAKITLGQRVERIEKKVDVLTDEVTELKASIEELGSSHNGLKATVEELGSSHNGLKATVEELRSSHNELKATVEELTSSHNEFKALQHKRHEEVMGAFREIVEIIGESIDELKSEIFHQTRTVTEQTEGRKIDMLFEESSAHKATLGNHEYRITELEKIGS